MLKSRKSLYIFLPLNVCLWGYIGYKLYLTFREDEAVLPNEFHSAVVLSKETDSLGYELSLNYEDPFLKNMSVKAVPSYNANESGVRKQPIVQPKPILAPKETKATEIKYLGLVHNKSSGVKTALVSINGQSHLIKPGETIGGIAFQQVDKDFIVVREGKEKITITR